MTTSIQPLARVPESLHGVARVPSIWHADLPRATRLEPTLTRADTIVVGAGFAGLSAAYHMLERFPGSDVVVLDSEGIGAGASARSTGMLTPGVGQNLAGLCRRVGAKAARDMYLSTLRAVEYVAQLVQREEIACDLHLNGQLVVARGSDGRSRLIDQARTFDSLDLPYRSLTDDELDARVRLNGLTPEQRGSKQPAALFLPTAGVLNPGKLLSGLSAAVQRRGGRVFSHAAVVEIGQNSPVTVTLANGRQLLADRVVLATNGYTSQLRILAGRLLPLHLRLLVTEPLDAEQLEELGWRGREAIIDSRKLFDYYRITEDSRIVFGGGRPQYFWHGATHEREPGSDAQKLLADLEDTFAIRRLPRVSGSWSGLISYVLDSIPVIARWQRNPHVVHVGGWCGHGIALSLTSGQWVADLLDARSSPATQPWFRQKAPLLPTEIGRWLGVRLATWAMQSSRA